MTNIKYAPHIPLIGNFPLGAEKILQKPPERIYSLPGFYNNDQHYINYQNNILGRNIEYVPLDPSDREFKEKIHIIVGTPPCASLSSLNCGRNETVKGPNCAKNDFMYIVAEQGIKCFDADVIMIENAPALGTNNGKPVADKLFSIAKNDNYSLTLYTTNTMYHGVPQNRPRTFAILWKSACAPIMDWFDKPRLDFADYIATNKSPLVEIINKNIPLEPYSLFIRYKTGKHAREVLRSANIITTFKWVEKNGLLDEALAWFQAVNDTTGIKLTAHAIKKIAMGLGTWDSSMHCFDKVMNSVIGRNMADTIHPTENRSLTVGEAMHMMAMPPNFELVGGKKNLNHVAQNVPLCTAADMVEQAVKFINGELKFTANNYIKQNNHKEIITDHSVDKLLNLCETEQQTLDEFYIAN